MLPHLTFHKTYRPYIVEVFTSYISATGFSTCCVPDSVAKPSGAIVKRGKGHNLNLERAPSRVPFTIKPLIS